MKNVFQIDFGETDETYTKHLEVKKAVRNKSFISKFSCNVIKKLSQTRVS